jgi:all-trans-8'-apo-beta-carotenal 15,15'-oxygenase
MFDGDGMVSAITFDPDNHQIWFRNRFVRTAGFIREEQIGGMQLPGTFGTRVAGGWWANLFRTDFKNVANTHVLLVNNTNLYALWEGGRPYKLDPWTLETVNPGIEDDLRGLLHPGDFFAAHYRYDPVVDTIVNFGTKLEGSTGRTTLRLYELDAHSLLPAPSTTGPSSVISVELMGTGLIHDFGLTQQYYVFSVPPASINTGKALQALLGLKSFASVIDFKPSNTTQIVLIPRNLTTISSSSSSSEPSVLRVGEDPRIRAINVPYHFSFHVANAYDDETTGHVVVDMVVMEKAVVSGWYIMEYIESIYGAIVL